MSFIQKSASKMLLRALLGRRCGAQLETHYHHRFLCSAVQSSDTVAVRASLPAVAALEKAPCLQCGRTKDARTAAAAVTCAVSGLHLACSRVCCIPAQMIRRVVLVFLIDKDGVVRVYVSCCRNAPIDSRASAGSCSCSTRASWRTASTAQEFTPSACLPMVRLSKRYTCVSLLSKNLHNHYRLTCRFRFYIRSSVLSATKQQPSPTSALLVTSDIDSWEKYLQLYTHDAQWLEDPRAMRLVSAAYSFVMTLSHFLPGTLRVVS